MTRLFGNDRSKIGLILLVFGGTYQIINATHWEWWVKDLQRDYLAEGAIFDGYTIDQVIARHFGHLAGPLFLVTFVLLIIGIILLWISVENGKNEGMK